MHPQKCYGDWPSITHVESFAFHSFCPQNPLSLFQYWSPCSIHYVQGFPRLRPLFGSHVPDYTALPHCWNLRVSGKLQYVYDSISNLLHFCYFQGQEFAEQYLLEYQRQDGGRWIRYRDRHNKDVSIKFLKKVKHDRTLRTPRS